MLWFFVVLRLEGIFVIRELIFFADFTAGELFADAGFAATGAGFAAIDVAIVAFLSSRRLRADFGGAGGEAEAGAGAGAGAGSGTGIGAAIAFSFRELSELRLF